MVTGPLRSSFMRDQLVLTIRVNTVHRADPGQGRLSPRVGEEQPVTGELKSTPKEFLGQLGRCAMNGSSLHVLSAGENVLGSHWARRSQPAANCAATWQPVGTTVWTNKSMDVQMFQARNHNPNRKQMPNLLFQCRCSDCISSFVCLFRVSFIACHVSLIYVRFIFLVSFMNKSEKKAFVKTEPINCWAKVRPQTFCIIF